MAIPAISCPWAARTFRDPEVQLQSHSGIRRGFAAGTPRALSGFMPPARHYSELIVWQLADEIRREVFKLTKRPRFARDFKAQGQADDAINSVSRNIAEGFACETHGEFATFLVYSVRSLNELQDAMRGAQEKGYADVQDLVLIRQLFKRLFPALGRFIAYLRRTPNRRRHYHCTDTRQSHRTDERH